MKIEISGLVKRYKGGVAAHTTQTAHELVAVGNHLAGQVFIGQNAEILGERRPGQK